MPFVLFAALMVLGVLVLVVVLILLALGAGYEGAVCRNGVW